MTNTKTVKVGDLCTQIRGVSYSKPDAQKEQTEGYSAILRANNITSAGIQLSPLVYVPNHKIKAHQFLQVGDVLIAASSGSLDAVGKASQVRRKNLGAFGAFCKALRPNEKVDPNYFAHYFQTKEYRHRISNLAAGANINNLKNEHLDELEIPLPPLAEQRRIAAILDQADALRQKRRLAIAKLDQLLQSVFLDMFGDPSSNPMQWPTQPLADLGTLDRGKSKHRPRNAPELLGGQHPLIQTGDVANSEGYITKYKSTYSDIGLAQSKKWPSETLCITIAANIASTGILKFEACFPDSVVGFIPNEKSNVEYVQFLFKFLKQILEEKAPQVAQKNINLAILRALPVPVPPKPLQDEFAKIVEQHFSNKEKAKMAAAKENDLFSSLQQRAFSGNL